MEAWYWIYFGGIIFLPLSIPLLKGRWKPSDARRDERKHQAMIRPNWPSSAAEGQQRDRGVKAVTCQNARLELVDRPTSARPGPGCPRRPGRRTLGRLPARSFSRSRLHEINAMAGSETHGRTTGGLGDHWWVAGVVMIAAAMMVIRSLPALFLLLLMALLPVSCWDGWSGRQPHSQPSIHLVA